jgi:Protein of unknown function (DUF2384)
VPVSQAESKRLPLDSEGQALAAHLVSLSIFLGLAEALPDEPGRPDKPWFTAMSQNLTRAGVAKEPSRRMLLQLEQLPETDVARREQESLFTENLRQMLLQMQGSPMPQSEWAPLRKTLGDELLAEVLGVSSTSLHRYATGTRDTPDAVAGLLHRVALITADLASGYNEYGMRRWFARPRQALDGRSPAEVLSQVDDADSDDARKVSELAAWLVGAGSAT